MGMSAKSFKLIPYITKPSQTPNNAEKQVKKYNSLFQTISIILLQIGTVSIYFVLLLNNVLVLSDEYPAIIDYHENL